MPDFIVPMSSPHLTEADIAAVNQVLQTPYLSLGPRVVEFEERLAAFVGTHHAVAVSSGTAGLHLCIIAAGIGEGDEVITTPFSFVASANCVLYERAIPIFVDIDPHTFNINPVLVAQAADDLLRGGASAQQWLPPVIRNPQSAIRNLQEAAMWYNRYHALAPDDLLGPSTGSVQATGLRARAAVEDRGRQEAAQ